jgi:hypothetical protein
MFKEKVVDSVNDYIVTPVNDYVVTPVNDYVVTPIITNPINNYVVTPIQNLVGKKESLDTEIDPNIYTTFESYPASSESTSLLEHEELSYTDHLRQSMYYSGISFTASLYFFINALLPNTLKNEGHTVLENLKKND